MSLPHHPLEDIYSGYVSDQALRTRQLSLSMIHRNWADNAMTSLHTLDKLISSRPDLAALIRQMLATRVNHNYYVDNKYVIGFGEQLYHTIRVWTTAADGTITPGQSNPIDDVFDRATILTCIANISIDDLKPGDDELGCRDLALTVARNPHSARLFQKIIDAYPDDKDIVMAIISHRDQGTMIQHASERLRADPQLAVIAAWTPGAYKYISADLLNNPDISAITTMSGGTVTEDYLMQMSHHWGNRAFIKRVWAMGGFKYLPMIMSPDMRRDMEFMKQLAMTVITNIPLSIDHIHIRARLMLLSLVIPMYKPGHELIAACKAGLNHAGDAANASMCESFTALIKLIDTHHVPIAIMATVEYRDDKGKLDVNGEIKPSSYGYNGCSFYFGNDTIKTSPTAVGCMLAVPSWAKQF